MPENVVLLSNRSAAYAGLGMNYEALDDAKRAIAMDPKFVKAYGRLGLALARLGQLEEAGKSKTTTAVILASYLYRVVFVFMLCGSRNIRVVGLSNPV